MRRRRSRRRIICSATYFIHITTIGEVTVALGTEQVRVSLVVGTRKLGGEGLAALMALILEVILLAHVLETRQLAVERLVAVVALELGTPVTGRLAVLVAGYIATGEQLVTSVALVGLSAAGSSIITAPGGLSVARLVTVDLTSLPARGKLLVAGATAVWHCVGCVASVMKLREARGNGCIDGADDSTKCITRTRRRCNKDLRMKKESEY